MSAHIELRRQRYYAVLVIPSDVRPRFAGKFKFIQSTGTGDRRIATTRAAGMVAKWQTDILNARLQVKRERGITDPILAEALNWRDAFTAGDFKASADAEDAYSNAVTDHAEALEAKHGTAAAKRFASIALGDDSPSGSRIDAFMDSRGHLAEKTRDQMRKDVSLMVARYPTLGSITHQAIKTWLDELTKAGVSPSSQERITSFCRGYWGYLQSVYVVPSDSHPFANLAPLIARQRNAQRGRIGKRAAGWAPFTPADVVALHRAAAVAKDTALADLITLGAYSGARIEELCALKLDHVAAVSFKIIDAKTSAGVREVPIHSKLKPLVKRLRAASADGYLLSGLTFNKYGDRSNAIGKRFGRLKAAQGYGEQHVFHSIRKTVVTLLENAGVSENLAADIVGHEKPRITYGLYSGGASLAVKARALELVRYPGWR